MKRLLVIASVVTLALVLVPAAGAQNVHRDFTAFAQGGLSVPGYYGSGGLTLSLDIVKVGGNNTATTNYSASASVFNFDANADIFAFGTQALDPSQYSFDTGSLNSAHVHFIAGGPNASSGSDVFNFSSFTSANSSNDVLVDLTWTAAGRAVITNQQLHVNDPNTGRIFHFGQNSHTRPATVTGSLSSAATGVTANLVGGTGNIGSDTTETVQFVRP